MQHEIKILNALKSHRVALFTPDILMNESFLVLDLSQVNFIKRSLNQYERKLKYCIFIILFYYHTTWH